MRQLTETEADQYTDASEIEFIHAIEHCASVHIGRNAQGVRFVLLMDNAGRAVVAEGM